MGERILFDGLNFSLQKGTGIATYTTGLVNTVKKLGYCPEILVSSNAGFDRRDPLFSEIAFYDPIVGSHPSPKIRLELLLARFIGKPFGVRPSDFGPLRGDVKSGAGEFSAFDRIYAAPNLFELARLQFRANRQLMDVKLGHPPDVFHATHPTPVAVKGALNIYTIHDLIPLLLPFTTLDDKKYMIELLRTLCKTADHIVTVSENSKKDIVRLLGVAESRVTNTYQSVTISDSMMSRNATDAAQEIESAFGVAAGEYYVFVGAIEPKKNLRRLIDAYAASGSRRPLLIAGGLGWQFDDDLEKIAEDRFVHYSFDGASLRPERKVRHLSYLPRSQLISLVRGARALFFPSLYEGFGLPVLEAMILGTAVLSANVASLPEIVGDAGVLVDPLDEVAIANGIRSLDQDDALVSTLVARGLERARLFSPQAYAARLEGLYAGLGIASTAHSAEACFATAPHAA